MNPRGAAGGVVVALALAAPVVMHFEGKRLDPYHDVIGVLTVCYGDTYGVEQRRYTDAECKARLAHQLAEHDARLMSCVSVPLADNVHAALLSWAYNVGTDAACKSGALRKINAGDTTGACAELSKWTKAGGKELAGLVRRRSVERAMCEGRPVAIGSIG